MTPSETLRLYVEGVSTPADLVAALTSDEGLKAFLTSHPPPKFAKQHTNAYYYLLEVDYSSPYGIWGSKKHIQSILSEIGVASRLDESDVPVMRIMTRLQPKWVDVPVDMMKEFLADAGDRTGKVLDAFVGARIAEHFRCIKKVPAWLQSPQWQFNNGRPMVFAGQVDLGAMYHDQSVLYIFVDAVDRTAKWVIQSA